LTAVAPSFTAPSGVTAFVEFARSRDCVVDEMLERVKAIYEPVAPLRFDDDDLKAFLGIVYLAARFWRPRAVIQTGTFVGTSAVAIALALRENGRGRVYTIDPEPREYFGVRRPVVLAREVISRAGIDREVELVRGYSTVPLDRGRMRLPFAPRWRLAALAGVTSWDMLVVDGDHTFEGCRLDLEHGAAQLAVDGPRVVVVHDYLGIHEVRAAVRAWKETKQGVSKRVVPSRCGIALLQVPVAEVT
jgi:hypothetical protein